MDITLDSNVLVYATVPPLHKDPGKYEGWKNLHEKAKILFENVLKGEHKLIIPFAVLVEVASVVSLLTGEEEFGKDVAFEIEDSSYVVLFDDILKDRAIDYAVRIKAGGFDNIIAMTSIMYGTTLITNDKAFYEKLKMVSKDYAIRTILFRDLDLEVIKKL